MYTSVAQKREAIANRMDPRIEVRRPTAAETEVEDEVEDIFDDQTSTSDDDDAVYPDELPVYLSDDPFPSHVDVTSATRFYLLVCQMNTAAMVPFMQYLVSAAVMELPRIDEPFADGDDPVLVRNAGLTLAMSWFPTWAEDVYQGLSVQECWKGAVCTETDTGRDVVLMLEIPFKYAYVPPPTDPTTHLSWIILDGILRRPHPSVLYRTFATHPALHDLYDPDDHPLPRPMQMRPVTYTDRAWHPVLTRPDEGLAPSAQTPPGLAGLGEHMFFLPGEGTYAVFPLQARYITRPIETVPEALLHASLVAFLEDNVLSIYFKEGDTPVWCILAPHLCTFVG